jgi:hypothetical protein
MERISLCKQPCRRSGAQPVNAFDFPNGFIGELSPELRSLIPAGDAKVVVLAS